MNTTIHIFFLLSFLVSCAHPVAICKKQNPRCTVESEFKINDVGNAGCLIKVGSKMVVLKHKEKGKLGVPGGTSEKGETAQCTAHRETWEEVGIEVVVGKLLYKFENGFFLFDCKPLTPLSENVSLKPKDQDEISEAAFLDPEKISPNNWRFPDQFPIIQKVFLEIK